VELGVKSALSRVAEYRAARVRFGRLLLALDFDGTIAHIVERPEQAQLASDIQTALHLLRRRHDTEVAFVSGRRLEDLQTRCGLDNAFYAGNHGLEICGPGVKITNTVAESNVPAMHAFAEALHQALRHIDGVYVEDKRLTLSVHFRLVNDATDIVRVRELVLDVYSRHRTGITLTQGKKVIEARPEIDWNKGDAVLFLLDAMGGPQRAPAYTIFVGDDRTDEDAFAAVQNLGAGVLVGDPIAVTAASAFLPSVDAVAQFIAELARD
jgi:trehalose 6-phosphate phosphatase